MRVIITLMIFLGAIGNAWTQQEAQYTQFMFNKLTLNPAYAGSIGATCFSALHRSQWLGLEGAPTNQVINFHTPFSKNKVGFGVSILHDQIGPSKSWSARLAYAYRIPVGKGQLGFGLQGMLRSYRVDWSETSAVHTGDEIIGTGISSKVLPNFGIGLYFQTPGYFFGFSIPRLIKDDFVFENGTALSSDYSVGTQHFYLMGGMLMEVNERIKFKPSLLLKYVRNTPLDLDLNANFIFYEKIWFGLSYRLGGDLDFGFGESIDFNVQYQLRKNIRAGLAYDFTLSKLQSYNSGTYEVMLEYCIQHNQKGLTNPRFF